MSIAKIALAIQKGGTGKTTTALCLGGALVRRGKRVLLIDLDPQANATKSLIDISYLTQEGVHTVYDVMVQKKIGLADCIIPTATNLFLAPATIKLSLAERHLIMENSRESILSRKLNDLEKYANTNSDFQFDFILLDCPPSLGMLTINALVAATGVVIPLQTSIFAEQGLSDFTETFMEMKEINTQLDLIGVVLTQVDNTKMSKDVAANVREILPGKLFKTSISRRAILADVGLKGPIQDYAPKSESAIEYDKLAEEIMEYVGAE